MFLITEFEARLESLEMRVNALEKERTNSELQQLADAEALVAQLTARYGEYVDKTVAAKILGRTRATVYAMLNDGRIRAAFGGSRVSVRSIAAYMAARTKGERA